MKQFMRLAVAVLAVAALSAVASAETVTYTIDKTHTEIGFEVKHFFSKVRGQFNDFQGTIQLDAKNLSNSSVEGTVEVASIDTQNERRDGHLKSEDFFAAEKFPQITLKSKKVIAGKKGAFKLVGDFTMRGVTKEVTFDGEFLGAGPVAIGGNVMGSKAGFTLTTTVNRKDFGINWNKTLDTGGLMLGDDVKIMIDVEADGPKADAK